MSTLIELKDWLKQGGKIKRADWKNCYLSLNKNDAFILCDQEYAFNFCTAEIFANDWEKVEKIPKRWKPADKGTYYYVKGTGSIGTETNDNLPFDANVFDAYNCFKTQKEAKRARDLWLAERELRNLADGGAYQLCYDTIENSFDAFDVDLITPYSFSSTTKAKEAIEQLGENKLKLIFGIK